METEVELKIEEMPFAEGTFNYAYQGFLLKNSQRIVLKRTNLKDREGYGEYLKSELKKNALVIALSNSFNKDIIENKIDTDLKKWAMVHFLNFSIFEN